MRFFSFKQDATDKKSVIHYFKWVLLVGLMVCLTLMLFVYWQVSLSGKVVEGDTAELTTTQVVAKVGALMRLPDEQPVVIKVSNADTLRAEQPFYAGVENGDYILLYGASKQAMVYSLKQNRLLNVGPIEVNNSKPKLSSLSQIKIEVRNGSTARGAAATVANELAEKGYTVIGSGDAANKQYKRYVLVVVNQNLVEEAKTLSGQWSNAEVVSELPVNEKPTEADILVIIGQ